MPTEGQFTLTDGRVVRFEATVFVRTLEDGSNRQVLAFHIGTIDSDTWCSQVTNGLSPLVQQEIFNQNRTIAQQAYTDILRQEADRATAAGELGIFPNPGSGQLSSAAERLSHVLAGQCLLSSLDPQAGGNTLIAEARPGTDGQFTATGIRTYANASGEGVEQLTIDHANRPVEFESAPSDGHSTLVTFDPTNTQPWDSHTTVTDADGRVTSDSYDYSATVENYNTTHNLGVVQITQMDANAAENFAVAIERDIYSGDDTAGNGGIGNIFDASFVNSYHDFNGGIYDIDIETGSFDTAPGEAGTNVDLDTSSTQFTSGYDFTNYDDAYSDWSYTSSGDNYVTYDTSDSWDWGDFWEPVILDLDGNGIQIIGREDSDVTFDIDGDGYDERTAWVGAGDGLLVLDLDSATGLSGADGIMALRGEIAFAHEGHRRLNRNTAHRGAGLARPIMLHRSARLGCMAGRYMNRSPDQQTIVRLMGRR